MKEIQGKSTLVRVSARFELSGVDCTVKLYNLPNYFCRGLWFVTEVMAAMLVDKNKGLFLFCKVNCFLANSAKNIYICFASLSRGCKQTRIVPILGKF